MLLGLLILMLISINLGGMFALIMQAGRGEWAGALSTLLFMISLDGVGFWLLRELRDRG